MNFNVEGTSSHREICVGARNGLALSENRCVGRLPSAVGGAGTIVVLPIKIKEQKGGGANRNKKKTNRA